MIYVIASIRIKEGERSNFLSIFNANVPKVKEEAGCIEYAPAVDIESGLSLQHLDKDVVTIIEKWESVEALHQHLAAPHMVAYQKRVKNMVVDVSIKVLQ